MKVGFIGVGKLGKEAAELKKKTDDEEARIKKLQDDEIAEKEAAEELRLKNEDLDWDEKE